MNSTCVDIVFNYLLISIGSLCYNLDRKAKKVKVVIELTKEKIKWHPAFAAAIQLELKEYNQYLDFEEEHVLTDEPLKIDVVVIKKIRDIEIDKAIGKILRKYNIFEYKSPTDYISIDDYYKVKAYAYLYKTLSEGTNSIDIEEVTITLTSTKYPKKLVEYLKGKRIEIIKKEPGVYYIENTDIRTQLIITRELPDEGTEYLKLLQFEHENKDILSKWVYEYIDNIKNPLYAVIMDVLTESNPNEILEVYRNMGVAKISEDNRIFLLDVIKKLELDKKLKDEGRLEGKKEGKLEGKKEEQIEIAKNLLDVLDVEIIAQKTGLTVEEVKKLRN